MEPGEHPSWESRRSYNKRGHSETTKHNRRCDVTLPFLCIAGVKQKAFIHSKNSVSRSTVSVRWRAVQKQHEMCHYETCTWCNLLYFTSLHGFLPIPEVRGFSSISTLAEGVARNVQLHDYFFRQVSRSAKAVYTTNSRTNTSLVSYARRKCVSDLVSRSTVRSGSMLVK